MLHVECIKIIATPAATRVANDLINYTAIQHGYGANFPKGLLKMRGTRVTAKLGELLSLFPLTSARFISFRGLQRIQERNSERGIKF